MDALAGALGQQLGEAPSGRVAPDLVILEMNPLFCRGDRIEHRAVRLRPVDEQIDLVAWNGGPPAARLIAHATDSSAATSRGAVTRLQVRGASHGAGALPAEMQCARPEAPPTPRHPDRHPPGSLRGQRPCPSASS